MSVTTQQKNVSGTTPAPPPSPTAEVPLLIAEGEPKAAPPETTEAPAAPAKTSPTTGSYLPLLGWECVLIT